jgi:hypothetical protein
MWGSGPPREHSECAVRADIRKSHRPVFYEDIITSNLFLDVMGNYTIAQLDNINSNNNNNLILQLDGTSLNFARIFRDCLNVNFPRRWTGRLGPYTWTPRSPVLTPLDVFLLC